MRAYRNPPPQYIGSERLSPLPGNKSSTPGDRTSLLLQQQMKQRTSWAMVKSIADEQEKRELIRSNLSKFHKLGHAGMIDWTIGMLNEMVVTNVSDPSSSSSSNCCAEQSWRFLRYDCQLHELMIKCMVHSYIHQVSSDSRHRAALNRIELSQVRLVSHAASLHSTQLYPFYAAEIVQLLIDREPESSREEFIRVLVDDWTLLDIVLNGLRYGLFTFKFCCLRLLKQLLSQSMYVRNLLRDMVYRNLYVPELLEVMRTEVDRLSNELRSQQGLYQSQILSTNNAVNRFEAMRLVGIMKENASLLLLNILLLNSEKKTELISIPHLLERVMHTVNTMPHDSYPESEIQLTCCNILYFLLQVESMESDEELDNYRQYFQRAQSLCSSEIVEKIFVCYQAMKSIKDLQAWANSRILKIHKGEDVIRAMELRILSNAMKSEQVMLNTIADITLLPENRLQMCSIQDGAIRSLLRLRKLRTIPASQETFTVCRTLENDVVYVRPNDRTALSIALKNVHESPGMDFPEILDFIIDSCAFVMQKAQYFMKLEDYSMAERLLTLCLKIIWNTEDYGSREIETTRISIYELRSDMRRALNHHEGAKQDAHMALHFISIRKKMFFHKMSIMLPPVVEEPPATELGLEEEQSQDTETEDSEPEIEREEEKDVLIGHDVQTVHNENKSTETNETLDDENGATDDQITTQQDSEVHNFENKESDTPVLEEEKGMEPEIVEIICIPEPDDGVEMINPFDEIDIMLDTVMPLSDVASPIQPTGLCEHHRAYIAENEISFDEFTTHSHDVLNSRPIQLEASACVQDLSNADEVVQSGCEGEEQGVHSMGQLSEETTKEEEEDPLKAALRKWAELQELEAEEEEAKRRTVEQLQKPIDKSQIVQGSANHTTTRRPMPKTRQPMTRPSSSSINQLLQDCQFENKPTE